MHGNPTEAARALIQSFGPHIPPTFHSVYCQCRTDRATGEVEHVLMVHLNPTWADAKIPKLFMGFAVEVHPWGKALTDGDRSPGR